MAREVAEVLRKARARIQDPVRHCQGKFARDAQNRATDADDPHATQWCALGAVIAETPGGRLRNFANAALFNVSQDRIVEINDSEGGHAAVLAAFDRAIAQEEQTP